MRIIDTNTCFGTSPQRRVEYAEVVTGARHFDDPASQPTTQDIDWSLDNLRRIMDDHDVSRVLAYSLRGKLYDFVSGNNETLDAASVDGRIIPVATVDPRRHFGCLTEIERCADLGIQVFRFFPDTQGWTVTGLPFMRLCETMAEYRPVVILPAGSWGHQSTIARRLGDFGLDILLTGATFTAIAESLSLDTYSSLYWETSAMHTVEAVSAMASGVGTERLLFGSNSPEYSFEATANLITETGIDRSVQEAIFSANAMKLLGLELDA